MTNIRNEGMTIAGGMRATEFSPDAARLIRTDDLSMDGRRRILMVVDDFHHAADPATTALIEFLARYGAQDIRVVLFSRAKPRLPLEDLRLKGLAMLFGQDLLAFGRDEAAAFFLLNGCPDIAGDAWEYSEGWIAAMRLSLREGPERGAASPVHDIEALVEETVFPDFDMEEQALLMQMSIMDIFSADEAARLTSDPQAPRRLRTLEDKMAFLARNPFTNIYRLHGIFRAYLFKRLKASPFNTPDLYRRAGECSTARGELLASLRYFAKAGRDDDHARILDIFLLPGSERLLFSHPDEIMAIVKTIPWRVRERRPMEYLSFVFYCLTEAGDPSASTLLEEAEERFIATDSLSTAMKKRVKGEAVLMRSLLAFNDLSAMHECGEMANTLLNGRSAILTRHMNWTFGCPHASFLYVRDPGGYRKTVRQAEKTLGRLQSLGDACSMGGPQLFRGEWLLERGEFEDVEDNLANAECRAGTKGQAPTLLAAAFSRARLRIADGRRRRRGTRDAPPQAAPGAPAPQSGHGFGDGRRRLPLPLPEARHGFGKWLAGGGLRAVERGRRVAETVGFRAGRPGPGPAVALFHVDGVDDQAVEYYNACIKCSRESAMSINFWNSIQISNEQQNLFLSEAGLDEMPDVGAMNDAQWTILAGILGEDAVRTIRESSGQPSLSNPSLPSHSVVGDWSKILLMIGEIRAKMGEAMGNAALEFGGSVKEGMAISVATGLERLSQGLFQADVAQATAEIAAYLEFNQEALEAADSEVANCEQNLFLLRQQVGTENAPSDLAARIAEAEGLLKGAVTRRDEIRRLSADAADAAKLLSAATTPEELQACLAKIKDIVRAVCAVLGTDFDKLQITFDASKTSLYGSAVQQITQAIAIMDSTELETGKDDLRVYIGKIRQRIAKEDERLAEMIHNASDILMEVDTMLRELESSAGDVFRRNTM